MMRLLIRADASREIGNGHLMRCLALAQEWKFHGGDAAFLSQTESQFLRDRIEAAGADFFPLEETHPHPADLETMRSLLWDQSFSHVALDGYDFDPIYQEGIRDSGCRTLVIDDYAHQRAYSADILLNQNLGANTLTYHCDPETVLLLGPSYALLRPEFMIGRRWRRETPALGQKILITLGGSDPDNVTLKVMQALRQTNIDGLEALVIVGASNPHYEQLAAAASRGLDEQGHGPSIRLVRNPDNMPELMAWADIAVSGGGSTCWEMAFMSLPAILVVIAENQRAIAAALDEAGAMINLGRHVEVTAEALSETVTSLALNATKRQQMSAIGRTIVDGGGAARVIENLQATTTTGARKL
jgi:UDP-2,4-diacetamido-2,4,6-trideoxy-beta-L-altropyranose hydrolase